MLSCDTLCPNQDTEEREGETAREGERKRERGEGGRERGEGGGRERVEGVERDTPMLTNEIPM